jgi:hypothetical protein
MFGRKVRKSGTNMAGEHRSDRLSLRLNLSKMSEQSCRYCNSQRYPCYNQQVRRMNGAASAGEQTATKGNRDGEET